MCIRSLSVMAVKLHELTIEGKTSAMPHRIFSDASFGDYNHLLNVFASLRKTSVKLMCSDIDPLDFPGIGRLLTHAILLQSLDLKCTGENRHRRLKLSRLFQNSRGHTSSISACMGSHCSLMWSSSLFLPVTKLWKAWHCGPCPYIKEAPIPQMTPPAKLGRIFSVNYARKRSISRFWTCSSFTTAPIVRDYIRSLRCARLGGQLFSSICAMAERTRLCSCPSTRSANEDEPMKEAGAREEGRACVGHQGFCGKKCRAFGGKVGAGLEGI